MHHCIVQYDGFISVQLYQASLVEGKLTTKTYGINHFTETVSLLSRTSIHCIDIILIHFIVV